MGKRITGLTDGANFLTGDNSASGTRSADVVAGGRSSTRARASLSATGESIAERVTRRATRRSQLVQTAKAMSEAISLRPRVQVLSSGQPPHYTRPGTGYRLLQWLYGSGGAP